MIHVHCKSGCTPGYGMLLGFKNVMVLSILNSITKHGKLVMHVYCKMGDAHLAMECY